jgi:hypothetical protein
VPQSRSEARSVGKDDTAEKKRNNEKADPSELGMTGKVKGKSPDS